MDGTALEELIDRYNAAWNAHDVDVIIEMHQTYFVFDSYTTGDVNVGAGRRSASTAGGGGGGTLTGFEHPESKSACAGTSWRTTWLSRNGQRAAPISAR